MAMASTEDPMKTLVADYLNLFTNGQAFSDVIFCVEGRQVHAHRCILAARSAFFRMLFCPSSSATHPELTAGHNGAPPPPPPQIIPVGVVRYDVFLILLQFLYSGQLLMAPQQARSKCHERACWHTHCSSAVDLALETLHAAIFFGADQLSILIQKQLASIVEKASIDDVLRILLSAKKQELHHLWTISSELVTKSGLTTEALRKHLPLDLVREIEDMRLQRVYGMQAHNVRDNSSLEEQRIRRMQQALDSLDVELVRLMVMGEGLNLDNAQALHYSVANCSREVVKALLELGAVDVNYPSVGGRTALHMAAEMASPEMISVLLDHHAAPQVRTDEGVTPLDIVQSLAAGDSSLAAAGGTALSKPDHSKLRLCLELLQSAAYVAAREEESSDGVLTDYSENSSSGLVQLVTSGVDQEGPSTPALETKQRSLRELSATQSMLNTCSSSFEQDGSDLFNQSFPKVTTTMNSSVEGYLLSMYPDLRMAMLGASESSPSAIF